MAVSTILGSSTWEGISLGELKRYVKKMKTKKKLRVAKVFVFKYLIS